MPMISFDELDVVVELWRRLPGLRLSAGRCSYGAKAERVQYALAASLFLLLTPPPFAVEAVTAQPTPKAVVRMVALGDSLTAGYLLPADASFPARLEQALRAKG